MRPLTTAKPHSRGRHPPARSRRESPHLRPAHRWQAARELARRQPARWSELRGGIPRAAACKFGFLSPDKASQVTITGTHKPGDGTVSRTHKPGISTGGTVQRRTSTHAIPVALYSELYTVADGIVCAVTAAVRHPSTWAEGPWSPSAPSADRWPGTCPTPGEGDG
jgi:hypothetical protein